MNTTFFDGPNGYGVWTEIGYRIVPMAVGLAVPLVLAAMLLRWRGRSENPIFRGFLLAMGLLVAADGLRTAFASVFGQAHGSLLFRQPLGFHSFHFGRFPRGDSSLWGHVPWYSDLPFLVVAVLVALVLGFFWILYRSWVLGRFRGDERLPGWAGVRAWLSVPRVVGILLFTWLASWIYRVSALSIVLIAFALLLAYPLWTFVSTWLPGSDDQETAFSSNSQGTEESECDRVRRLRDQGKISEEECRELLEALESQGSPGIRDVGGRMGSA